MVAPFHFSKTQSAMQWKCPTSPTARKSIVPVCWKSYGTGILGCKRKHPRRVHASKHNSQCERLLPHTATAAWGSSETDLDVCRELWSFSTTLQPNTAQVGHKTCCSLFPGIFRTICSVILTLLRRTYICFGLWSSTWEVGDTTLMKKRTWLFANGCECKSPMSTATEFLNLCQDGKTYEMC
jgi:hypothetical protein